MNLIGLDSAFEASPLKNQWKNKLKSRYGFVCLVVVVIIVVFIVAVYVVYVVFVDSDGSSGGGGGSTILPSTSLLLLLSLLLSLLRAVQGTKLTLMILSSLSQRMECVVFKVTVHKLV